MTSANSSQRLLSLLPAIYREDEFLADYLGAFERVLLGLEQRIDTLDTLFDPLKTPEDFLPWLSTWVAFTLRADLDVEQRRAFLARVVPLYRQRGTAESLRRLLSIFTRGIPDVIEKADDPPHFFRVTVRLPQAEPAVQLRQSAIARALIEMEKPAHTDYQLDVVFPAMQIGVTSHIGVDTLLGIGTEDDSAVPT